MYRLLWGACVTFVIGMVAFWLWCFQVPHWSTNDLLILDLYGLLGGLVYLLLRWIVMSAPRKRR